MSRKESLDISRSSESNSINQTENQIPSENSNLKVYNTQTQIDNTSHQPLNQNLPTPDIKDSKKFFENLMDKLSQKKSQTISVSIFMFLRENDYKPMSQQALLDKLSEKFQKDPRSLLKYKTLRDHFTNESQIKNGFIAAIRENMGLKKTKINNIDYIGIDFNGIVDYFRNLKIRHASQGILDEEDVKFLFPDITELTLTGKKRLRKYYPSTTRQKRHKKINFGLDDYTSISKGRIQKQHKKNQLYEGEKNNENKRENNFHFQNSYPQNWNNMINPNINNNFGFANNIFHFHLSQNEKAQNEININVSVIINSINPFKEEELLKEIPSIVQDIESKVKNIDGISGEVQSILEKIGTVIENKIKSEKEILNEDKMDIEEKKKSSKSKKKDKIKADSSKDDKDIIGKEPDMYEHNRNIIDKTYSNLEYEVTNIKNLEKFQNKYKNEDLIKGHKKLIDKYSNIFNDSINKLCELIQLIDKITLDEEANDLLGKIKELNRNLNEKSFYFDDINKLLMDYKNNEFRSKLKEISLDEIKKYYFSKKDKLLKEIE